MQIRARGIHSFGYHDPNPLVFTPRRGITRNYPRQCWWWFPTPYDVTGHDELTHFVKQPCRIWHGPLARYVQLRVAHTPGMPGTFSPPPRISDPDMHYGTCVTHVPWCMPGSQTTGFLWSHWRGKRSRHSRCLRNPQFYVSDKRPMGKHNMIPLGAGDITTAKLSKTNSGHMLWGIPQQCGCISIQLSWFDTLCIIDRRIPLTKSCHAELSRFFVLGLNELLKKQPSCHWFEVPWRSCAITVMLVQVALSPGALRLGCLDRTHPGWCNMSLHPGAMFLLLILLEAHVAAPGKRQMLCEPRIELVISLCFILQTSQDIQTLPDLSYWVLSVS